MTDGNFPAQETENPEFLTGQLITYIGNKRNLLGFIGDALDAARRRLGKSKLDTFDAFAGSGVVSRYLKRWSATLWSNDLERYAETIAKCYLTNREDFPKAEFDEAYAKVIRRLESEPLREGLISGMYAPRDDGNIQRGERAFYTTRNARYLDTARALVSELPERLGPFFLGPLLSEASIHANTSGVFKGFYKNSDTGLGQFGGKKRDALARITGNISLPYPVLGNFSCLSRVLCMDAIKACAVLPEIDLAYLDPPYNQHPYGSNYFMLNTILDYTPPEAISPVSGIPAGWNRSAFNRSRDALPSLERLVAGLNAKFLLISFNSEGFISRDEMTAMLGRYGTISIQETGYNTFRGSRNLGARGIHVTEYLYLVEKR
jgi:adenine-specific DNA-methyltransferase